MHMVFLGVVKSMSLMIANWQKKQKKFSAYNRQFGKRQSTITAYNLDWCLSMPYLEGKMGAWVSENQLAWARLNKWVYSTLPSLAAEEIPQPTGDPKSWKKKCFIAWFRSRGLPSTV
jgi:hypothetical protein